MKTLLSGIIQLIFLLAATSLQAAKPFCGELDAPSQLGPFDYRTVAKDDLDLVESEHFTSEIANLAEEGEAYLGAELSYTLVRFPNHYPALQAMVKLSLRENDVRPMNAKHSVECYFDRAMRFRPGDAVVRMLYAQYLLKLSGRSNDAIEQYQEAVRLQPENANINYNLGLLYLKQKNYEQSIIYAKKAYGLGFPLPGLRSKLQKAGKWDGKVDENKDVEP